FAPCEKVIVDKDNNISLISLFQELTVEIPASEQRLPDGKVPVLGIKWSILSLWQKDDDDPGDREYDERFHLIDPAGQPLPLQGRSSFSFGDKFTMWTVGD